MNRSECEWLARRLETIPDEALFPVLDVGSSTLEFRQRTQPYIDANIFGPLRARSGVVYHLDFKAAPGVDIVGDLMDPALLTRIRQLNIRSAIVSNVLEHVAAREPVCTAITKLIPPGGYLFVSGPHDYPYHADPIDTMFRPTIEELHACFPGTELIEGAILDAGNWRQWNTAERGRSLPRTVVRMLVPFYRPKKWWEVVQQFPYLFRHITAVAVVLRKVDAPVG